MTEMLKIAMSDDASFQVSIGGTRWLESAPIRLFADHAWQNLSRTGVERYKGHDVLGAFSCLNVSWSWSDKPLHTALKVSSPCVSNATRRL